MTNRVQFTEPSATEGKCPVCGKKIIQRSTRGKVNYCSRVCASQSRYATRYRGTNSGPMDRPSLKSRTKLP